MLDAALVLAAKGLPVFPLNPGGTTPRDRGFYNFATTDPDTIRRLWGGAAGEWNVGISTGGRLVGIDVDVKGGKDGEASFDLAGFPKDTFTVRTKTGGFHYYYWVPEDVEVRNCTDLMGPGSGIDVRGHHGYLVAPGSRTPFGNYQIINDAPVRVLARACLTLLKTTHTSRADRQDGPNDDAARSAASTYLVDAPIAIQGQGGDDTTYRVACGVYNCGVSADTALDLILQYWNYRCIPPWDPDALGVKIRNAYEYAKGSSTDCYPDRTGPIEVIPPGGAGGREWYRHGDPWKTRERWLIYQTLPAVGVALLVGESGSGKTFLSAYLAECVALGTPLFGNEVDLTGGTIILAGEAYGSTGPRLSVLGKGERLPIAATPVSMLRMKGEWESMCRALDARTAEMQAAFGVPVRMIIVDTIPASGLLEDENDNNEITPMMKHYLGELSERYQCLVLGLAHPPKSGGPDPRGGGAYRASADYLLYIGRGSARSRPLELDKARDAAQRRLGALALETVKVGDDEKGRPVTTCRVIPSFRSAEVQFLAEEAGGAAAPKREQSHLDVVRRQFDAHTLSASGLTMAGRVLLANTVLQRLCAAEWPRANRATIAQRIKRALRDLEATGLIERVRHGRTLYFASLR